MLNVKLQKFIPKMLEEEFGSDTDDEDFVPEARTTLNFYLSFYLSIYLISIYLLFNFKILLLNLFAIIYLLPERLSFCWRFFTSIIIEYFKNLYLSIYPPAYICRYIYLYIYLYFYLYIYL